MLVAFTEGRDHAAFTALVARHGPIVWRTCRAILGDGTDAEDGFQAAFIALCRKAGTVRPERLAGWLARVSRDIALNLQRTARRRDAAYGRLCARVASDDGHFLPAEEGEEELRTAVREELIQLPERLRATLSLYYLEGKTQPEVGRILGITAQAVSKRLRCGLVDLRERLARRGIAVTAGVLAAAIGGVPVAMAVPYDLIETTAEAARAASTGSPPATAAARLALDVARADGATRLKWYGLASIAAVGSRPSHAMEPKGSASLGAARRRSQKADSTIATVTMRDDVPGPSHGRVRGRTERSAGMSDKSMIEWTHATLNIVVGCDKISSGCTYCHAIREVQRMASNPNTKKISKANKGLVAVRGNGDPNWTGVVRTLPGRLVKPFRWTKPRLVFVNSLSDFFHDSVPLDFIQKAFDVMRATP